MLLLYLMAMVSKLFGVGISYTMLLLYLMAMVSKLSQDQLHNAVALPDGYGK